MEKIDLVIGMLEDQGNHGAAFYVRKMCEQRDELLEALKISRAYIASRCGTPDPEDRFADQVLIEIHKQIDAAIANAEK